MPKNRPGRIAYRTATKVTLHGAPCFEQDAVGVAVKQKEPDATAGITGRDSIAINEDFAIISKGVVEVAHVSGVARGQAIYITTATNALGTTGGAGTARFGRVHELPGTRGVPTGRMTVDLDDKDFAA